MFGSLPLLLAAGGLSVSTFCQPTAGEIVFGLNLPSGTSVDACSRSLKQEGDFAFVGIFPGHATGTVALEVVKDGDPPRRRGGSAFTEPGNQFSRKWHVVDVPRPGPLIFRMKLETERRAAGEFDLTN